MTETSASNGSAEPSQLLPPHRAVLAILTEAVRDPWLKKSRTVCSAQLKVLLLMQMSETDRQESVTELQGHLRWLSGQAYEACEHAPVMRKKILETLTAFTRRIDAECRLSGQSELLLTTPPAAAENGLDLQAPPPATPAVSTGTHAISA